MKKLLGKRLFNRLNNKRSWIRPAFLGVSALFLIIGTSPKAQAATSAEVDIHVSLAGAKSLLIVGATAYDYGALNVAVSSVSASSFTIRNDSTVFIETYTITGANAISDSGGTDWTLASSTGTNQYALAAQFSNTRPADLNASWQDDDLSLSASVCSATQHGNGTESQGGSNVNPGEDRALWFRIRTPSSVTDAGQHTVTVTISVQ